MSTRTVTGTIKRPNGRPWFGAKVGFSLETSTFTTEATYPKDAYVVTAADGTFSVDLEAGLAALWRCDLPDGTAFRFELADGDDITLEVLRATYAGAIEAPDLPTTIGFNGTVPVGTISTQLVPANSNRASVLISNAGTQSVHIAFGVTASLGAMELVSDADLVVPAKQAISAITASGTVPVYVLEEVYV